MKTKIVLWGENEKEEKLLIGIELIEADNLVQIHTVPEQEATEDFYNLLMNQWRNGQDVTWPSSHSVIDRPLSMTDGLLPDELKTQRQDILARAKTEWHFVVLSSKLYASYAEEIHDFKEKVDQLVNFDNGVWEEMKELWTKVQAQVYEKNLFREHAIELRSKSDQIFETLKGLKKTANSELEKVSKEQLTSFIDKLQEIEKRIEKGLGLQPIFNELKKMQQDFKEIKFTRKHHNDVWRRIDKTFKLVKEKKYGKKEGGGSGKTRTEARYDGLLGALEKMQRSVNRDKKDIEFQLRRINTTDGQLELQIRQAKMAMLEERLSSKQVKLDDMLKTKGELEKRIESEKKKEEARQAKRKKDAELKKAKAEIKENIADNIAANKDALSERELELIEASKKVKAIKEKRAKGKQVVTPPVKVGDETPATPEIEKTVPVVESENIKPPVLITEEE